MLKNLLNALFTVLYPVCCVGCGKKGYYFCPHCLRTAFLIDHQKCPVCQQQALGGKTHPRCNGRYTLDGLFSLFEYRGIIRHAIIQLKYRGLTDIETELARLINFVCRKFYENDLLIELEDFMAYERVMIAPIPLHWWRKMQRRFNQAEFFADIIGVEYERPVIADLLIRIKNTPQQVKLAGKARQNNVKNIFRVKDKYLTRSIKKKGKQYQTIDASLKNILLIDDVITSGATLRSAANTLKRAGVEKIWALTLAA